jgi:hypothetical protein
MIDIDATSIMGRHKVAFTELESWLYSNIGPGGRWLTKIYNGEREVEIEQGDEWGVYSHRLGDVMISIVDDRKAEWFLMRWA